MLEQFDANQERSSSSYSRKRGKRSRNLWICKPGENSNRGYGISLASTRSQILELVQNTVGGRHTLIIQKYIEDPFL